MVCQGKIEKLAWHSGRTVRNGHGIKPRCGSSNPHSAVAHCNDRGTRRGFLPRGLYDACPQAHADSLRSAVTGRHPTNLSAFSPYVTTAPNVNNWWRFLPNSCRVPLTAPPGLPSVKRPALSPEKFRSGQLPSTTAYPNSLRHHLSRAGGAVLRQWSRQN